MTTPTKSQNMLRITKFCMVMSLSSSQNVHVDATGDVEEDVAVGLKLAEGPLVAESREGRVEKIGGEGADHAAEERLPR